jgi:hypothetical protein
MKPGVPKPKILSGNVWHEFFENAPVDWFTIGGEWKISNRWTCTRKWSWYQGSGTGVSACYSKHRYEGDQVHECYHALKDVMHGRVKLGVRGRRRYARRDVNFSFCTNGKDLNSGYTVLFGGHGNKGTYLLKRNAVVAFNRKFRLPEFNGSFYDLHWQWWCFRVERIGERVRVLWQDRLVLDYRDPEPISGGHVALWTFRNGVIYALLRSAAQQRVNASDLYHAPRPPVASTRWKALEQDRVACEPTSSGRCLVTNLMGGGRFAVRYDLPGPVDLTRTPLLRIPFRPSPAARVNLHVRVSGKAFVVKATGPVWNCYETLTPAKAPSDPWVPYLADPLGYPRAQPGCCFDPQRSEMRVDLLAEARRRFPDMKEFVLEDLAVGNTSNEDYLLAGFNGNPSGCTYTLGDAEFLGARSRERWRDWSVALWAHAGDQGLPNPARRPGALLALFPTEARRTPTNAWRRHPGRPGCRPDAPSGHRVSP